MVIPWLLKRPFLLIAAGVLLILLPATSSRYSLLPQNPEVTLTSPVSEPVDYFSRDPTGAIVELGYVTFARQQLSRGTVPLWSPYQSLGHPFVADMPSSALFSPLSLLRLTLPPRYWDAIFILNLILGCWFLYLLARSYHLDRRSAVVSAISLCAIGSTQLNVQISSIAFVTCWIPLALCGVETQLALVRSRFSWLLLVGGIYGLITGGHPTITLLAIIFLAGYILIRLVQERARPATILRIAALGSLALLITAAQWLPFARYMAYHGGAFRDLSWQRLSIRHAPAFLLPYVFGQVNVPTTATQPAISLGDYWSLGWLAPALLIFFVAGLGMAGRCRPALALLLASAPLVLWAFGIPPFAFASHLPFLNRVRPHYVTVALAFVAPLLTGYGYQFVAATPGQVRRVAFFALAVLAAATAAATLALCLGGVSFGAAVAYIGGRSLLSILWVAATIAGIAILAATRPPREFRERLFWLILYALSLCAVGYFAWGSAQARVGAQWTTALCFVPLLGVALLPRMDIRGLVSLGPAVLLISAIVIQNAPHPVFLRHDLTEARPYVAYLQKHQRPEERSYGVDGYLFPNFSAGERIAALNITTGMVPSQVDRFFRRYLDNQQDPEQFMGLSHSTQIGDSTPMDQVELHKRFWDYLAVRYFVTSDGWAYQTAPMPTGSAPELLTAPIRSQVPCPGSPTRTVCYFFGTYGRSNLGKLTVAAFDSQGRRFAEAGLDSAGLRDLACARFEFPEPVCREGHRQTLEIDHHKSSPSSGVAVFLTPGGELAAQAIAPRNSGLQMVYHDPETGGRIWKNPSAHERVYIAPESRSAADWQHAQDLFAAAPDLRQTAFVESSLRPCASHSALPAGSESSHLERFEMTANRVSLRVDAFTPGTLVLVDTFMPGWTALVDGKPKPVFRVNGLFRGACIDAGPHEVVFLYHPAEWKLGVGLSFVGLAIITGMVWRARRNPAVDSKI